MSTSRFQTAPGKANKKLKQADTKTTAVKRRSTQAGKAARAPKITFVLFDEIKAPSPVQSRPKVFDVDQFPTLEIFSTLRNACSQASAKASS